MLQHGTEKTGTSAERDYRLLPKFAGHTDHESGLEDGSRLMMEELDTMPSSARRVRRYHLRLFWVCVLIPLALAASAPRGLSERLRRVADRLLLPRHTPHRPQVDPTPAVPPGSILANPQAALTVVRVRKNRVPMTLIEGGIAGTRRAARRCDVRTFVEKSGAQAGLNGAFFADASLRGRGIQMIGPTLCGGEPNLTRGACDRIGALTGRPLVLLSPTRTCILPYRPAVMANEAAMRRLLPGLTDAFLGGVWLVHQGKAASETQLAQAHVHDAEDPRRRAFFVLEPDGRPGIGATTDVTSSQQLAVALQAAGVREAVLLDSGFSTSLVFGTKIVVTGHTAPGLPSRPVPHAVVLYAARPAVSLSPGMPSRAMTWPSPRLIRPQNGYKRA